MCFTFQFIVSIITPDGSNNHREPCVSSEETVVSSSSNSTRASCENTSTPIVHLIVCDSTSNNESSHVTSGTSVVPQHSSTDSLGSSYIFQPPNISGPVTSILLMDDESSEGNSPLNGANATSVLFRPTQFKTTSMTSSDETILAGHLHREKLSATSDGAALTTESSAREESSTSQVSGTQKSIGVTPK